MDELERLLEEILTCIELGQAVDWSAYEKRRPELVAQLQGRIATLNAAGLLPPAPGREGLGGLESFKERYEFLEELGHGGMGRVWRAHDRYLERDVALKMLDQRQIALAGPVAVERFLREARTMALLEHPSIVPILDIGRTPEGVPYFTMKLVAQGTLKQRMHAWEDGTATEPPLGKKLELVLDAARAVQSAHESGVLHRDIKPSNLLIGAFDEVMVSDWGLASLEESTSAGSPPRPSSTEWTSSGEVIGTPSYMAPEQARGEPASEKADVWGLGAVLLHMLTAFPPFVGGSLDEVLTEARLGKWSGHRLARCKVPDAVRQICRRALATDVESRYSSAAALADDLEAFLHGERGSAWRDPLAARLARALRRHPVLAMSALLLFTLALVSRDLHKNRVAAARAQAPEIVARELQSWATARDGWYFGNDGRSLTAWIAEYLETSHATYERLGVTSDNPESWVRRLRDLRSIDPSLERGVIDELYQHALVLYKSAGVQVYMLREGLQQPPHPALQGDWGRWESLLRDVPQLADDWIRTRDLLPIIEPSHDLRSLWRDVVLFMETGLIPENVALSDPDDTPSEGALRGRLLVEMRRLPEARFYLEDAILRDPGRASLHQAWIDATRELDAVPESAQLDHRQAWAVLRPSSAWASGVYGAKLLMYDRPEARAWIDRAVRLDRRVTAPIARSIFSQDGDYAVELLGGLLEDSTPDAYAMATMADFRAYRGESELELDLRRRILSMSDDLNDKARLARCLQGLVDFPCRPVDALSRARLQEAARAWEATLVAMPASFQTRQSLGLIRLALGEFEVGLRLIDDSLADRREDMQLEGPTVSPEQHRKRVAEMLDPSALDLFEGSAVPATWRDAASSTLLEARSLVNGDTR